MRCGLPSDRRLLRQFAFHLRSRPHFIYSTHLDSGEIVVRPAIRLFHPLQGRFSDACMGLCIRAEIPRANRSFRQRHTELFNWEVVLEGALLHTCLAQHCPHLHLRVRRPWPGLRGVSRSRRSRSTSSFAKPTSNDCGGVHIPHSSYHEAAHGPDQLRYNVHRARLQNRVRRWNAG